MEARLVPAGFVWQDAWQVTLDEATSGPAWAETAFGVSSTADGQITDIGQAGDQGAASAAARAFSQAGQYWGDGEATATVSFSRTFELSGSSTGWYASLDAALKGQFSVDFLDGAGQVGVAATGTVQILEGTLENPGTVTHGLNLGESYYFGEPGETRWVGVSQSASSDQLVADGTYTVIGSLESWTYVNIGSASIGSDVQSLFWDPPGFEVTVDAVPWDGVLPPPTPSITITDACVGEGHEGTTAAAFTVSLSEATTQSVTVDFATQEETAWGSEDYHDISGTLTFNPGETSKTITVEVIGDRVVEAEETFSVYLREAVNGNIADDRGSGTILDDEPRISIIYSVRAPEGDAGTTPFEFTVGFSRAYDLPMTVDYGTSDYTATAGSDYQAASGTLTFAPGQTSQAITVQVIGDEVGEPDEYFTVWIRNASAGEIVQGSVSGDILNDDALSTKFCVVDASADKTFEYAAGGQSIENYVLRSGNNDPRGAASYAGGDRVWVIDNDDYVYVYDAAGNSLGSWKAKGLSTPEGIASDGTDLWIVDRGKDKVFRFAGAASRTSGSASPTSSFALNSGNREAKGIETDGTYLWVVNNTSTDKVFKYTVGGSLVGSWTLTGGVTNPTGITLDPSNPSDIWVVDASADKVFQYSGAANRTSGSQAADAVFALASGNSNSQGIADPPLAVGDAAAPDDAVTMSGGVGVARSQLDGVAADSASFVDRAPLNGINSVQGPGNQGSRAARIGSLSSGMGWHNGHEYEDKVVMAETLTAGMRLMLQDAAFSDADWLVGLPNVSKKRDRFAG